MSTFAEDVVNEPGKLLGKGAQTTAWNLLRSKTLISWLLEEVISPLVLPCKAARLIRSCRQRGCCGGREPSALTSEAKSPVDRARRRQCESAPENTIRTLYQSLQKPQYCSWLSDNSPEVSQWTRVGISSRQRSRRLQHCQFSGIHSRHRIRLQSLGRFS